MEHELLLKIADQFVGMSFEDLTKLESNVFGLLREAGLVRLAPTGYGETWEDDRIIEKV